LAVAGLVLERGANEDEAIAAVRHDAVEKCSFGDRGAAIVDGCSDSPAVDANDSSVLLVSAAEKLHIAGATPAEVRRFYTRLLDVYRDSQDRRVRPLLLEPQPAPKNLSEPQ
jgi:hypothetical protein